VLFPDIGLALDELCPSRLKRSPIMRRNFFGAGALALSGAALALACSDDGELGGYLDPSQTGGFPNVGFGTGGFVSGTGGFATSTGGYVTSTGGFVQGAGGIPVGVGGAGNGGVSGNGGVATNGGAGGTANDGGVSGSAATGGATGSDGGAGAPGTDGGGGAGGAIGTGGAGGTSATGGAANTGGDVSTGGVPSTGGAQNTGGAPNTGGATSTGGAVNTGGAPNTGGAASTGGAPSTGGAANTGGAGGGGSCCPTGDCLCHGPNPTALTSSSGSYSTSSFTVSTGTVYYPTNAEPPLAGIALCGGFTNTGPEMAAWGPFYASHGIVVLITSTLGTDFPDIRATKLLASIAQLKSENTRSASPLFGKMAGRYGTSGYSMGGGGTTLASQQDSTLRTSIGLAEWGGSGTNVKVPTLLLCGTSDGTAPCNTMSQPVYNAIPSTTSKMVIAINGAGHLNWFGPTNAGAGTSGKYALAFQKVFLEGDERWRPLLLQTPSNGTRTTNIQP
jgi:hypothetical protein